MKATSFFQQHLCKLGQLRRSNGRNSQVYGQRNLWLPHFRTFCELVEGEENKLTTFSTWTIMLGCNESNSIFQQHLCKLGQLRRSNGRNSQVLGKAMKKRPTGHYKKYSHLKGRDTAHTKFYHVTIRRMTKSLYSIANPFTAHTHLPTHVHTCCVLHYPLSQFSCVLSHTVLYVPSLTFATSVCV